MNNFKKTSRQFLFRYATLATFVGLVSFGTWWSFTANKSHTDVTAIPASAEIPHGAKGHTCQHCQHCKPAHPTAVAIRKAMSSAEADGVAASFKDVTEEQWWSGIEIPYQDILPREALIAKVGDAFTVRFGDKAEINGTLTLRHTQNNGTQAFGLKLGDSGFNMHLQEFADGRVKGTILNFKHPLAYQINGNKENYTLTRVAITDVICANWDENKQEVSIGSLYAGGGSGSVFSGVPLYNSRPGAIHCIYIDFDGETVTGTRWNTDPNFVGGPPAGDITVTPGNFSPVEIQRIADIVAEDFRGFDVTVTTDRSVYESYAPTERHMNIVTEDQAWTGLAFDIGGVAYLSSFGDIEPSWTFNPGVNAASMTVSHEVGHTLSLTHDGNSVDEYQSAIGNWGPIMGAPFGASVVQWSQGEYEDANNPQDDIAAIEGYLGFIADDYGSSTFAATPLPTDSEGAAAFSGVISSEQDLDVFEFQVSAGTVDISITPAGDEETHNFKARGRILDENGGVIADINDLGTTSAIISESLSFGTYFLEISAGSNGTWATGGYEAYGSIGAYNVTATAPVPTPGDTDGDGLTDDEELVLGLDPYDPDTDGDEITDRKEAYPYYIVPGTFTFQEALTDAARRGGRLATIETPERLYKLKRGILDDPHPYVVLPFNYDPTVDLASRLWIGGHDSEEDGRFRWLDPVRDWVTPANELQGPEIGSAVFGQMFSGVNELRNVVNINALTVGREVIASGIPAGSTITGINVGTRTATLSNPVGTDFTAGVGQVTVVNGGLGYTVAPTVTFNPANGATAVANISGGRVTSVTVTNTGTGFINPPLVEFTGGNGGGATANALLTKAGTASVLSITVDTPGAGYTSTPTVVIAGGNPTTPATATASINGSGAVTAVTIVNPGSGYTSQPTITLVGGGATTDATATAKMYVPQGRIYSPASSGIYSNWNTVLPGNRSNTPEGIYLDSGTAFTWGPAQFTSRFGYVLELPLTDPFLADSDADDLIDSEELFTFGTDPLNTDTDLDGVDDFVEIYVNLTEPLNPDTDADGLTDGAEDTIGTDPLLVDTDGDAFSDFEEVNAVPPSDPLDANSRPTGVVPVANELLHKSPEPTGPSRELTISDTYAPFGTRPDTDRVSEDGSVAIRDVNGVIIWVDRLGQSVVLPETALSKTLYVSNSECIVWRNRFDPTYNERGSVSRLVIYRKDVNNIVTTSPEVIIPGTLMETVGVSPATYGFTLIAAETDITDPVNESIQQYQNGSNAFGPTYALREVDVWDARVTTGYRVTFDGQVQELADRYDFVPRNSQNIEGMRLVGSGADASQFLTMTVALDFFDSPLDADPGFYKIQEYGIWATWNTDTEQLSNVPLFSLTDPVTEMGYISNQRLILETAIINPASGAASGNYNLQDIRIRDTGAITLVNTVPLAQQTSILALNTFSRAGTAAYLYTTGPLGDSISLFRFDQSLTQIGATVTLPSRITSGNAFVRNPRDASLLIRDDNGQSVWIPSVLHPLTSVVQGLGTPKVLASDYDSRPLFVSTNEAVVWRNAGAPAQLTLPNSGVVPVAEISHYTINTNGSIVRTPITPPILGRFVARSAALTLDADTEGWFVTTFDKTAPRTTVMRTYRLRTTTTSDRDYDGLLDVTEFALNTDPNNADTEGDGINDGLEIFPFYVATGSFTYEEARQEAIRRGGRLAVLDTADKLAAVQRLLGTLTLGTRYWLGGSDQEGPNDATGAREGQYRWMNASGRFFDLLGAPVGSLVSTNPSLTPWAPSQPNNVNNADGLLMRSDYLWEMAPLANKYGFIFEFKTSDPLLIDTDTDGLTDEEEFQFGTNPNLADTDADGISDLLEVRGYNWVTNAIVIDLSSNATTSNPVLADTDADGVSDYLEVAGYICTPGPVYVFDINGARTNPNLRDSDGDGYSDGLEVCNGSDPNDPSGRPSVLPDLILEDQYNQVENIGSQDIPLDFVWSPLGQRTDNSRWSDDGSVIYADASGVLLWQTQNGQVTPIPNSANAIPLIVSNNKVMVWHNAFNNPGDATPGDGDGVTPLEVYIYNINPATGVISNPVVVSDANTQRMLGANILATAPITTTSTAYHLITAEVSGSSPYRVYRVTLDGNVQAVSSIAGAEGALGSGREGARVYGHGTDGSTVFLNYWVDAARAGATTGIWDELVAAADAAVAALPSRVLYTSATRVVYESIIPTAAAGTSIPIGAPINIQRNGPTVIITLLNHGLSVGDRIAISETIGGIVDPITEPSVVINGVHTVTSVADPDTITVVVPTVSTGNENYLGLGLVSLVSSGGNRIIDARGNAFTGFTTGDNSDITPNEQDYFRFLQISTQTIAGDTRWAYALNTSQDQILAYRLTNNGFVLEYRAQLPQGVILDEFATVKKINPLDGSAIISSDNIDNVIWVGNIGTALQNATLFPSSSRAEGMFVSSEQALLWNNAKAPVGPGGVIPDVELIHYQREPDALAASDISSSTRGKFVLATPIFSPPLEKWIFKTLEKTGSKTTTIRSYGLTTFSERDSDNDGMPDAIETLQALTSALSQDTDGDGLADSDEVYPYYIINGNFTWEEAQADADLRGGRLAVINNRDDYSAMVRRFGDTNANSFWLGATDGIVEGTWRWGDLAGTVLNSANWDNPGELDWAGFYAQTVSTVVPWATARPNNANNADGLILRADKLYEDRPVTERRGYIIEYTRTDPTLADTDGDGLSDENEYSNGTDPTVIDRFVGVPELPAPGAGVPFANPAVGTSYYGLLYDPEQGHIGNLLMKVSKTGAFTYSYQGLVTTIKASGRGSFSTNGAYSGGGPLGLSDIASVDMQYVQQSGEWVIMGVMERFSGKQYGFELRTAKYGKSNPYPAPSAVTMAFALPESTPSAPLGDGVATGAIDRAGLVKLNIYMPNGARATSSGPILKSDDYLVNALATTGSQPALIGAIHMTSERASLDYDGTLRLYSQSAPVSGQSTGAVDQQRLVMGSAYRPASKGLSPYFENTLSGWNTRFNLIDGDFDGVSEIGAWGASNKITIPGSPVRSSLATFTPKTGLIFNSHTKTDAVLGAKTTASGFGVVLQKPEQMRGYYISPLSTGRFTVTENDGSVPTLTSISPINKLVPVTATEYYVQVNTVGAWEVKVPLGATVSGVVTDPVTGIPTPVQIPWITAEVVSGGTGLKGNGNGVVKVTVQQNTTGLWFYSTLEIAGVTQNITQDYEERR